MFSGAITALVTPFKDNKLDERSFGSFVEWQIKEGIHGLVPAGTTGEAPTLNYEEHHRVIECCVEAAAGRVPVIAGTGSNSTDEAIILSTHAQKAKADALLISTPYYNKPNQQGLYEHFKAIHDATDLPIILYNIPGRSAVDLKDDTIVKLAELPNIVGIKDATGDVARMASLMYRMGDREFSFLSGDDVTATGFNAHGGNGCISVTSNIAPKLVSDVQSLWLEGSYEASMQLQNSLIPLHEVMFCDTNPIPVKYAVSLMGNCECEYRLPLTPPTDYLQDCIRETMESFELV